MPSPVGGLRGSDDWWLADGTGNQEVLKAGDGWMDGWMEK